MQPPVWGEKTLTLHRVGPYGSQPLDPKPLMIELEGVRKAYRQGEQDVVACEIDALSIGDGEHVALIGRSGMGKTTVLNIIAGIPPVTISSSKSFLPKTSKL